MTKKNIIKSSAMMADSRRPRSQLPAYPPYCLAKLEKARKGFQQEGRASQKVLQNSKITIVRKQKDLVQMKEKLVTLKQKLKQVRANKKKNKKNNSNNNNDDDDDEEEETRDCIVDQHHYIANLERDIVSRKRKAKKLKKMTRNAQKIASVMQQEFDRAVANRPIELSE